jgi:general stress protein 26
MGEVKNLISAEAIDKIKKIAMDADIALFTTNLSKIPLATRPMGTLDVDDEGNLWFLSKNDSDKNLDISYDNQVQLFYSNKSSAEYLSIYGHAQILTDRTKIEEYWTPLAKAWFKEGKDDPTVTLLKVTPADAYYWDTKENKLITLIKIAFSAVSGSNADGGIEGKIKV